MDEVAVESPVKQKHKRINYALAALLVSKGATYASIAAQCGAKNAKTLQVGLNKKGITATASRKMLPSDLETRGEAGKLATRADEILRERLGNRLLSQVDTLSGRKVGKLQNEGQGEAAVLKTMAETFKSLYGGAETNVMIFGAGMLEERPSEPVIDVQADEPGK